MGGRPELLFLGHEEVLARHDADRQGAVVQGNGPDPAARVVERLKEGRILVGLANIEALGTLPVRPVGYVLEALVEAAVLEVLCRHDPVAPAGVDEVVEHDVAFSPVFARPVGRYGPAWIGQVRGLVETVVRVWLKMDCVYLPAVKRLGSTAGSVGE